MSSPHEDIVEGLRLIFQGIDVLQQGCGTRHKFTIDGRLVGDIGELVAAREFRTALDAVSRPDYDAVTEVEPGKTPVNVQIKAGFKDSLTFRRTPELYIGLRLSKDGAHEVIFNGPGSIIAEEIKDRKGFGETLLSVPMNTLRRLNKTVQEDQRVPLRLS